MHGEAHGHGHHVCTRCGWTFPNAHPSAKHRRAHKKVCGKLEGFKVPDEHENGSSTHLADFEDEHLSDENHNKVEETTNNVKGSGEIDRQISNKSEEEEFSDAIAEFTDSGTSSKIVGATESDCMFEPSKDLSDDQIQCPQASENVKDQMETETKEDHASSSAVHSIVGSNAEKIEVPANLYPENTQIGENSMDFMQVNDTIGENKIDGSLSTLEASASKIASEEPEIDANSKNMDGSTGGEMLLVVADACVITMTDTEPMERVVDSKEEETIALGQKVSQDEIPPDNDEGCNAKEVNESLPVLLKHAHMHVEEFPEMTVEDCKEHELLKSEPDQILDCSKAMRETELHPKIFEGAQLGFLSSKSCESSELTVLEMQVLEDKLQKEEEDNKIIVQEVLVGGEADISVANDIISKDLESDELEAPPDATHNDEPHFVQQDKSNKILPETDLVVSIGGDTIVSSSDVVIHEATAPISGDHDVVREEAEIDNSDITVTCIGGAIEENLIKTTNESSEVANCLSEPVENLKEIESSLDSIVDSTGKAINGNHSENIMEPQSDAPVCQDVDFQEGSKELEVSRSVDLSSTSKTEVQVEPIGADNRVAELLHEETKLIHSGEVGLIQSCAEIPKVEESMLSALDTGSQVLSSGKVEDNNSKSSVGAPSDVRSQPLEEEENNNIVKQHSDASAVVPPDWSVDSISQTDSVDGNWGSVSDGTVLSVKDASDIPFTLAAEALPGTNTAAPKEAAQITDLEKTRGASEDHRSGNTNIFDAPSFMTLVEPGREGDVKSAASEIQTVQNPQQVQSSSQAVWFPSVTQVVNESQGRKKNEEIIEKVASWNSGKSHTPLRSLLVEANLESKQKVKTTPNHPTPPTMETDVSPKQDNDGLSAKTVNPTTAAEVTVKSNEEKEWNSPARLPVSREKRKIKSWVPFMCCSSVN
ncbi:zinc finger protein [Macleaya cordata]|uniref:Zinc finger protein n=1 Tax=Macleaya cordata TaxID=56857 RepID=A0A200QR84_MACCD|nr:zinc finger protein [Macleaya cordata]